MPIALLPYIEHGTYYEDLIHGRRPYSGDYYMKPYVCPVDPTLRGQDYGNMSYAANGQVFAGKLLSVHNISDGLSYTAAFAEHYSYTMTFKCDWGVSSSVLFSTPFSLLIRRPSFADFIPGSRPYDPLKDDVYPVTSGNPPVSRGSIPELTFQVRPRIEEADPRIPQTGHPGGMPVLMLDGRVIMMRKGTAAEVFWGLVTPRGGEAVDLPD